MRARIALVLLVSLLAARPARAVSCEADEVKVGEDEEAIYCKKRSEYLACFTRSGERWRVDKVRCAGRVEQAFRDHGKQLSFAAASCVFGCLGNALTPWGCLSSCGLSLLVTGDVMEEIVGEYQVCFDEALADQRSRERSCREP